MNIKISDNNNLQKIKADNVSVGKKPIEVVMPEKNPINKYSSKVDLSKLLKDPKLEEKKVDFDMDKSVHKQLEISKSVAEDESALSVASSVLSAVKIPQVEPIKLTVNILTADKKKENLVKDLECKNYEGIANNTVDLAKSGWGSAVSVAKVVEWGTEAVVDFGILSKTGSAASKINKVTTGVSSVATKIAIPFSVVGTALNGWDIKSANDKVRDKKNQIKALDKLHVATAVSSVEVKPGQKAKLNAELQSLKTNRTLKSVAFGLSAVSTATLIASVKNPTKAHTYAAASLVSSIASSVVSAFADDKLRAKAYRAAKNF